MNIKLILALLGALVLGVAAASGLLLSGLITLPFGPVAAAQAAAAAPATPPPTVTVMYPTTERVVNLSDPGTMHYLKVQVTLEFVDRGLKAPPKAEAVKAQQDTFAKDMTPYSAIIEDRITTVLSSKTSSQILSTAGKDGLKQELIQQVTQALNGEEQVVNVYFPTFIIQ